MADQPLTGQGGVRPSDQNPGMNSDLSEGPTGAGNGLTADFNANTGGTSLIDNWEQVTLPGGGIVAGSASAMALFRFTQRTNTPARDQG